MKDGVINVYAVMAPSGTIFRNSFSGSVRGCVERFVNELEENGFLEKPFARPDLSSTCKHCNNHRDISSPNKPFVFGDPISIWEEFKEKGFYISRIEITPSKEEREIIKQHNTKK